MRHWPIRWRLTLWYGGVLAAVLAIFGTGVYAVMRHQLLGRVDSGLHEELSDVLSEVTRASDRAGLQMWLDRRFGRHEGFDFQITDEQCERVFVNERLGDTKLPVPDAARSTRPVFWSAELEGRGRWRIVSQRVRGPDCWLTVQVARTLTTYDHEMNELLVVLLLTGPVPLLAAIGGGYWLSRKALAPVEQMRVDAQAITAHRLHDRLNVSPAEDELGRLALTLNEMLDRLETSFREVRRFTADASHELRTPLAVIRSEAENALHEPLSDDAKQDLLGNILEECQQLTWITDQLLTLSREDAGLRGAEAETVNVGQLAQEVAHHMRVLAEAKHQQLDVDLGHKATITGDPIRLRQVIYNLLQNAIKYTPPSGRVRLSVATAGDAVQLTVEDTGVGIAPEHLPHVCERFYRVDKARTRAEGGAGLGLSIVQSIVTAHNGELSIHSTPGVGTTCVVRLPSQQLSGR